MIRSTWTSLVATLVLCGAAPAQPPGPIRIEPEEFQGLISELHEDMQREI